MHADEEPYNPATWQMIHLARRYGARSLFFTWQNLYRRYLPPFSWIERYCFGIADRAIAGNAEAVQVLRRKDFAKPIDVIPQFGVDPEIFRPSAVSDQPSARSYQSSVISHQSSSQNSELRIQNPPEHSEPRTQNSFRVGFVGRLVEQKGVLDLLEAAARLKRDYAVVLVGAGPLQPAIETRATELGMRDRVEMLGGVPSDRMPEILNTLDVLVLPSRTRPNWKEQFGRALVEAMACEVPVVGSDSGEIPNVIGDVGLIFPEGNVDALATHLEALRGSPELRSTLGARGRARVLERFTQTRIAEQTYRVYREMLG